MEEFVKKGLIVFVSIFLWSIILLYFAGFEIYTIETWLINLAVLFLFSMFCTAATLVINRWFKGIWGSALSVFLAVMAVGLLYVLINSGNVSSGYSFIELEALFVIIAAPAAIINIVIWKLWEMQPMSDIKKRPAKRKIEVSKYKYNRKQ